MTQRVPARVIASIALAAALGLASHARGAELLDQGPVIAFGFAEKHGRDLFLPSLGWRWRFSFCNRLDDALAAMGTRMTWYVEPMAAGVFGDEDSVELQVVPALRFEAVEPWVGFAIPFLEGGIGLMYTGLDGLGFGSNVLFSDNVGIGFDVHESGWSFGYRYRHASHAGFWAESNSGLDAHYLVVRYDLTVN